MANKYAGTKTEKNLWDAFAGESMARNKYTYFASVAKKAGYEQIAALFLQTAENEKEHAKLWFKALGEVKIHQRKWIRQDRPRILYHPIHNENIYRKYFFFQSILFSNLPLSSNLKHNYTFRSPFTSLHSFNYYII